jgi:DNA repair protein RecO (recombination protein O)
MVNHRKVQMEPAWLLHQRDFRETSRIVEFFTRDYGRVALFVRGVRSARSPLTALLQPFQPLMLSWQGSGDGGRVTALEAMGPPVNVAAECRMGGFYLNELVLNLLTREDAHPDVFESYAQAVSALALVATQRRTLRQFEKRLLESLGYLADYTQVSGSGVAVVPNRVYHVRPGQGVVADVTELNLAASASYQRGEHLLALASEQWDDPAMAEPIRQLLAMCIDMALDGRPLKTREVAQAVRAFARTTQETNLE